MARFLNINATYNPLTMDKMLKVPLLYDAAYKDTENRFKTLSDTIADYEQYARMYPNSDVSQQYLKYIDDFNNAVDDFYNNGLNSTNRNTLSRLHRDYNRVVKPFKTAVGTYNAILTQRQKDYKDDIIGNDIDLDYILQHPEYDAAIDKSTYITGKQVYNISKDLFKGLNQFNNTPIKESDGIYNYISIPQSYSQEDIYKAFTGEGPGTVTPELQRAVDMFKQQTGYNTKNKDQQEKILYYGLQGALTNVKAPKTTVRAIPRSGSRSSSNDETPTSTTRGTTGTTTGSYGQGR